MRAVPKSELKAPTLSTLGFSGTAATAAAVLRSPPLIDAPAPFSSSVEMVTERFGFCRGMLPSDWAGGQAMPMLQTWTLARITRSQRPCPKPRAMPQAQAQGSRQYCACL